MAKYCTNREKQGKSSFSLSGQKVLFKMYYLRIKSRQVVLQNNHIVLFPQLIIPVLAEHI